jgi:hypothetical protein
VAVDNVGYVTVLTVRSAQISLIPNNELIIFTNQNAMVKICKEREPARDIISAVMRPLTIIKKEG